MWPLSSSVRRKQGEFTVDQKHSGLGIASFIVSTVVGFLTFLLIIVAGVMEASTPGGIDESSSSAVVVGLLIVACIGIDLVAFGLGIAGLMQKDRRKIFSVLGVVFSTATAVGTILLIVIGNTM